MRMVKINSHRHVLLCLFVSVAVHLCGCASGRLTIFTNNTQSGKVSVRKVEFSEAPALKELADHARQIGNEMYPKILTLLADDPSKLPLQFDIVFKKNLAGYFGQTVGTIINLLMFVDATYGPHVIRELNTELRRGSYSDSFFAKATGKSMDELWTEFQKTPAFTPVAAETLELQAELGYVNGQPPKDIARRLTAYLLQQPGGELTMETSFSLSRSVFLSAFADARSFARPPPPKAPRLTQPSFAAWISIRRRR